MPFIRWDPSTGEHRTFERPEEVPPDWLDHHPEDVAFAPVAKPGADAMSRKETVAALKAGGVPFETKASDEELTLLLTTKLREALDKRGQAFDLEDSPRALLERLSKKAA